MQARQAEEKDKDKVAYFSQLYALFQDSDDEDGGDCNDNRAAAWTSTPKTSTSPTIFASGEEEVTLPQHAPKTATQDSRISTLRRVGSEPTPNIQGGAVIRETQVWSRRTGPDKSFKSLHFPTSAGLTFVAETLLAQQVFQRRMLSDSVGPIPTSSSSPAIGVFKIGTRKRKEPVIKLVPESRQIFKGLRFFYVLDDDVNPIRRARITKAREYGVDWVRDWTLATHIIVDEGLKKEDVLAVLKVPSIPSDVIIVNETYPIECLQFRDLLLADQPRFLVKGQPQMTPEIQVPASQSSDRSLQLKAARLKKGRWDHVPPKGTQPCSENTSGINQAIDVSEPTSIASSPGIPLNKSAISEELGSTVGETYHNQTQIARPEPTNDGTLSKGEEFEELVREMQSLDHLPLDDEDDDAQSPSREDSRESGMSSSDEESQACRTQAKRKKTMNGPYSAGLRPESFSCMEGGIGDSSSPNPNARTIEVLQEMAEHYTRINDTWRSIAYRKAITKLRAQPRRIMTAEQALELPSIGKRLAAKIEEIVITDRLRRLENAKAEPGDQTLQLFLGIYGVGPSQAWRWVQQGYKTLEDLKARADLNANQRVGLEHYDDLLKRIPRVEIEALGDVVRATARSIDDEVEIIIGGSYRRGCKDSGDVDFILTRSGTSSSNDLLPFLCALTETLKTNGFLVAALAIPKHESGSKWNGCCVLPNVPDPTWRRIDVLLVPATELGAALIYFTGNDIFNRSIRLWASKKGMVLNQRGLFKNIMRGPGRVKLNSGLLVESADEKKIFKSLGVKWRPPEQRIC